MELGNDYVIFGTQQGWGENTPFGLDAAARRQHLYVIGQTGTGKSTLLRNLILQDVEAGRGVALIDPHGDLALEILNNIPEWRTDDVVYFNPACRRPLAVNLFRAAGANWHLVASGIVSAFKKIWEDSWGPRLEYMLFATIAALIQCDNASLLGASRMLRDARYRAWVVRQVKDPLVRSFWEDEFELYNRNFMQEAIAPIQNKVGQLFFSPHIRHVLGQVKSNINFRGVMDEGHIFIANLCKGSLGEAHASLLGSFLITGFEVAALSRADVPERERRDFFLYADEFQNYATKSFVSMLSESRKFRLGLTLAHQYMGQISDELNKAIFGNIGSLVAFRVSEADGSVLERQFGGGYTRSYFTGLNNFEVCARFLNGTPLSGNSLPPLVMARNSRRAVMRRSRQKYGTRRKRIEKRIKRWLRQTY